MAVILHSAIKSRQRNSYAGVVASPERTRDELQERGDDT